MKHERHMLNTVVTSSLHCTKNAHVLNLTLPQLVWGVGREGGLECPSP